MFGKDWIRNLLIVWLLGFLGLTGCAHNSKSNFNVPGVADGHLTVDLELNVPMLGGTTLTKASVQKMIDEKMKKLGDG